MSAAFKTPGILRTTPRPQWSDVLQTERRVRGGPQTISKEQSI